MFEVFFRLLFFVDMHRIVFYQNNALPPICLSVSKKVFCVRLKINQTYSFLVNFFNTSYDLFLLTSQIMNLLKFLTVVSFTSMTSLSFAQSVNVLPSLKLMAEPELRQESGVVPFQEDTQVRKALQHQVIRHERELQNVTVDNHVIANYEYQPKVVPDMGSLSPFLQQYVMSIANGLQSSDPTQGLYIMLQSVGIDRNNINDYRSGALAIKEINIEPNLLNSQQQPQLMQPPRFK
jgi:hypothetical protein